MDVTLALRMLTGLAVIVVVLFGLQAFARAGLRARFTSAGDRRLVSVLETTFLPSASSLHVVKIGDKVVVVGRSGGHIALLCEIPRESVDAWLAVQPASPLAASAPLGALVERLRGRRT